MSSPAAPTCVACGANGLKLHLRVAGKAGPEGLIPTTDRYGSALADIVRCESCGHMQLALMPSEAELRDAYEEAASSDYVEEETGQRATARRVLATIERYTPRGDLLDVGCWVGFLLAEARDRGWTPLGVEPSAFASAYARERLGLDVISGDLFDPGLDGRRFDAVFLGDVIEHLTSPGDALDRIASLLAPTGVVCMALPDAGSAVAHILGARWWSVLPTHVQYFTRQSIATLLRAHGFEPLLAASAPKAFTIRYYLTRLAGYSRRLADTLVGMATTLGLADRLWAPDFRDRMLVVARAPGPRIADIERGV